MAFRLQIQKSVKGPPIFQEFRLICPASYDTNSVYYNLGLKEGFCLN